jgi:hypothetical protein
MSSLVVVEIARVAIEGRIKGIFETCADWRRGDEIRPRSYPDWIKDQHCRDNDSDQQQFHMFFMPRHLSDHASQIQAVENLQLVYDLDMFECRKSLSSYMILAGILFALLAVNPQPGLAEPGDFPKGPVTKLKSRSPSESAESTLLDSKPALVTPSEPVTGSTLEASDPIVAALRAKNFALAERTARSRLDQDSAREKRTAHLTLATVLAARAWDADLRARSTRLSGNDVLILVVLALFGGAIVGLLLKYGPQRPKIVGQTERWIGRMEAKNRDDAVKQAGAALYSLLILGLVAGGLFVVAYFLIHLIAELDSPAHEDIATRKLFEEAKTLIATANAQQKTEAKFEDSDVLGLYADYLRKTGDRRQAGDVERRIQAMQICGRGRLPPRPR